ncbi:alcohol dehydrogenase [Raphidocelis subcapitata]|uniref:alcohol dehydrogenase (NADP(+)) n=1 Tax=Raphidocelis subcapitata TaxID=307507 RepID=A0A2V0P557_9CHLO|nr:alcohol dehydrogenase [Raphidocelis subcapitata]|eukprot:GBF94986.1 alcohol dehydrogenase [Raphidocelis subcapitata]
MRLSLPSRAPAAAARRAAPRRRAAAPAGALKPYRGFAVTEPGGKFEAWEYSPQPLGPNDIEIKVTHNGLCHSDLHMRDNDWGITSFPLIAGHEVVGVVEAKGDDVTGMEVGDRVGYGWLRGSCRSCDFCLRGNENLCAKGEPTIVGPGCFGGFQPLMRAPAAFAYHVPEGMDSAEAAPLLCAGITVYSPLRKYVRPAMHVAILGVGGLGHLAVQFAAAMGASVTALVLSDDEIEGALALGASDALTSAAAFEEAKGRFDVVVNCASARVDGALILGLLRADGVMVQVGIPGGGVKLSLPLQDLVFSQKSCAGSIVGGRADMQEMLNFAAAKGIKPLIETYKLTQINEAAARVATGKARYRVVMATDV